MSETLIGIGFAVIASLIGVIWKMLIGKISKQGNMIDEIEEKAENSRLMVHDAQAAIKTIHENCQRMHRNDISESQIRAIFKEELKVFEERMEKQLTTTIKLSLFEEGYISPEKTRKQKGNANKN